MPSAWIVRLSVHHTRGACHWTNGGWLTRRGAGRPVRPPVVCSNRPSPPSITGSDCSVGMAKASKVWAAFFPGRTVVEPISMPPL